MTTDLNREAHSETSRSVNTSSHPSRTCAQCQEPGAYICEPCGLKGPRYCSITCQRKHWKANHYKSCVEAIRNRERHTSMMAATTAAATSTSTNHTRSSNSRVLDDITAGNSIENIPLHHISPNIIPTEQQRTTDHNETQPRAAENEQEIEDESMADELRFYTSQIYRIIKPVVACIILSIFWVKVAFGGQSDYSPTRPSYVNIPSSSSGNTNGSGTGDSSDNGSTNLTSSFTNAAIIIGQIIAVTIIIVFLFKKGWIKILIGFFMVVVSMLLGFMSYILILNLIQVFFIPLDYITMVFALWNFAIVGLVSIFWKGPLWLQQTYLTLMSSLMAFSLTGLEQWTTWILLGLLAIWDLIAVLCPFGPLKMLIESSKKQQREVPALLYSVNAVWFMAATHDHFKLSDSIISSTSAITLNSDVTSTRLLRDEHQQSNNSFQEVPEQQQLQQQQEPINSNNRMSREGFMRLHELSSNTSLSSNPFATQHSLNEILHEDSTTAGPANQRRSTSSPPLRREDACADQDDTKDDVDDEDVERTGLKLGLGDFVFYSVLIARAAMYDWITTVCCTVAVLTGLTTTIFLLAIFKKALPALPISIAFGMLYYFIAKTVLVPYVRALCVFGMIGL